MKRQFLAALLLLAISQVATGAECKLLYVSGSSYYVDVGRNAGLIVGTTLEVLRERKPVGQLIVRHIASARASCDLVSGEAPQVGDTLHYVAALITPSATPEYGSYSSSQRVSSWHGRIGARQQAIFSHESSSGDLFLPSLDLRLDGRSIGGSYDIDVDARAQRSYRSEGDDEGRTRVYRLSGRRNVPGSAWQWGLGRQNHARLSSLGFFDGLSAEWTSASQWSLGALVGTVPDPENYAPSGDVVESAATLGWRKVAGSFRLESLAAGVGIYEEGEISREYVHVGLRFGEPRWWITATQDLDIYRDWRKDAEGQSISPTSHFVSARWRAGNRLTLHAGVDGRRAVRLLRDRETPQTDFDDNFRNGTWGGLQLGLDNAMAIDVRAKTRSGGGSGGADSGELRLLRVALPWTSAWLGARFSVYRNDFLEGRLGALSLDWQGQRVSLRTEGGWRDENAESAAIEATGAHWISVDGELHLTQGWMLVLSWDQYGGESDARDEVYSGISYRF